MVTSALPSVGRLVDMLLEEHRDGAYYYRGQVTRHPRERIEIGGEYLELESILPADMRWTLDGSRGRTIPTEELIREREENRRVRDTLYSFLCARAIAGVAGLAWLKDSLAQTNAALNASLKSATPAFREALAMKATSPESMPFTMKFAINLVGGELGLPLFFDSYDGRRCWSLSQHYLAPTALIDVTRSVEVAAWFATNFWRPDGPPTVGAGVIYRFDAAKVATSCIRYNQFFFLHAIRMRRVMAMSPFLIEISDIPAACALRPQRQVGASLLGFDQRFFRQDLAFRDAIDAFEFKHGAKPFSTATANREYLIPTEDPFLETLDAYSKDPIATPVRTPELLARKTVGDARPPTNRSPVDQSAAWPPGLAALLELGVRANADDYFEPPLSTAEYLRFKEDFLRIAEHVKRFMF